MPLRAAAVATEPQIPAKPGKTPKLEHVSRARFRG
jgi:hypothetical protein